MSEKYFITHFKNTLGITPGALLGYTDPYTFSKAFKKYYNVAPSHFV